MRTRAEENGFIFVLTGNGKGKTTSALGQALRFLGHGKKVAVVQFMKGLITGEIMASQKYLLDITWINCGEKRLVNKLSPSQSDIDEAMVGLEHARQAVFSDRYDLVILDEINVAIDFGLIPLDAVMDIINKKPKWLYLGLTGRGAPEEIITAADLVTEMKEIKHPFNKHIPARKGFDF